jgi:hypothetical protein
MVIAVMVAGLFMNASLARAFDDAAWVFVATFLGIQLGRTAWMLTTPMERGSGRGPLDSSIGNARRDGVTRVADRLIRA